MTRILIAAAILAITAVPAFASSADCDRYPYLCERGVSGVSPWSGVSSNVRVRNSRAAPIPPPGIVAMVDSAAWSAGIPTSIAHAIVRHESNYRPNLRGAAGEWGLTQIKCPSARSIGFTGQCHELADAATNLTWGFKFLRAALDKGGTGCAGVSLHNIGIFARPRCTAYGRIIMGMVR